jgi:hypothetical protein
MLTMTQTILVCYVEKWLNSRVGIVRPFGGDSPSAVSLDGSLVSILANALVPEEERCS